MYFVIYGFFQKFVERLHRLFQAIKELLEILKAVYHGIVWSRM